MIKCDRCGGSTQEKRITSKKPETMGKTYTVLECLNGCKNGKWSYTFFPPKENGTGQSNGSPASSNQAVALLAQILNSLHRIEKLLGGEKQAPKLDTDQDMEAPF